MFSEKLLVAFAVVLCFLRENVVSEADNSISSKLNICCKLCVYVYVESMLLINAICLILILIKRPVRDAYLFSCKFD